MKIAFINGYQNERGAETFVKEISSRLKKHHEVSVISGNKKIPVRWPFFWRAFLDPHGFYTFWFTFKNIFKICKERFDIVIPINGGWQPAIIRLITWLYGGKMVISGQSGMGWDDKNNLWCFPDFFVALSAFAQNWAKRVNPFVRVTTIPNGVDTRKFKPEGERLKLPLKKPIVISVGALTSTKRLDLVIKSLANIKNVSLLIVGDGELKEDLERLGVSLLKNRFKLVSLPYEDMPKVYRSSDLFTLVSESYYSFEIAIVEALATNLPVVANLDDIRREIVKDAGFLVDPNDVFSYTKALKKALDTKWGNRPRNVSLNYDWDKICQKYEELFKSLLEKS